MASSKKSKQQQQDGNQNKLNTNTNTNNKTTTVTTTTSSTTNDKSISKNGSVEEADEIIVLHEDSSSCGSREIQQRDDILIEDNNCQWLRFRGLFKLKELEHMIMLFFYSTKPRKCFSRNLSRMRILVPCKTGREHFITTISLQLLQNRKDTASFQFVPEKVNAEDALAEWKSA
ncbi:hypothetical protein ACFE04_014417 [Oxalis oulophora]